MLPLLATRCGQGVVSCFTQGSVDAESLASARTSAVDQAGTGFYYLRYRTFITRLLEAIDAFVSTLIHTFWMKALWLCCTCDHQCGGFTKGIKWRLRSCATNPQVDPRQTHVVGHPMSYWFAYRVVPLVAYIQVNGSTGLCK